jgi:hypothetical protein
MLLSFSLSGSGPESTVSQDPRRKASPTRERSEKARKENFIQIQLVK